MYLIAHIAQLCDAHFSLCDFYLTAHSNSRRTSSIQVAQLTRTDTAHGDALYRDTSTIQPNLVPTDTN